MPIIRGHQIVASNKPWTNDITFKPNAISGSCITLHRDSILNSILVHKLHVTCLPNYVLVHERLKEAGRSFESDGRVGRGFGQKRGGGILLFNTFEIFCLKFKIQHWNWNLPFITQIDHVLDDKNMKAGCFQEFLWAPLRALCGFLDITWSYNFSSDTSCGSHG